MFGGTYFHFLNDGFTGATIGFLNWDEATSLSVASFFYCLRHKLSYCEDMSRAFGLNIGFGQSCIIYQQQGWLSKKDRPFFVAKIANFAKIWIYLNFGLFLCR